MEWPISKRKLSELTPLPNNPRKITKEAFSQLKEDLRLGHFKPIIIDKDNVILGGNQTYKAMLELYGSDYETNVSMPPKDLTEEDRQDIIILDNNGRGENDSELLSEFEDSLKRLGFDALLPETVPTVEEDDYEEPDKLPSKVKMGETWQLGKHRLMCGDSTSIEDVESLMDENKANVVFTDPPYNADYSSRVDKSRRKPWGGILNDNMTSDQFDEFLVDINSNLYSFLKEGGSIYECIDWKHVLQMGKVFMEAFTWKALIIWNKNYFGLGTYYRTKHELILFGTKGEKVDTWNGNHDEMDVWDEDREKNKNYVHPTQKPVTLVSRAILNSSKSGDIVMDLFGGSGTTLITCEQTNRICYMMELDEHYCDVIVDRWEKLTGQVAINMTLA